MLCHSDCYDTYVHSPSLLNMQNNICTHFLKYLGSRCWSSVARQKYFKGYSCSMIFPGYYSSFHSQSSLTFKRSSNFNVFIFIAEGKFLFITISSHSSGLFRFLFLFSSSILISVFFHLLYLTLVQFLLNIPLQNRRLQFQF